MNRTTIFTATAMFKIPCLTQLTIVALAALGLSSCVVSEKPLLVGSKPVFGEAFDVILFNDYRTDSGYSSQQIHYAWANGQYASSPTADKKVIRITAEPLTDSDLVIERTQDSQPGLQTKLFSYFIARRIARGAYLFAPINENDLSPKDRAENCEHNAPQDFCPVVDHDRLILAAKATAGKSLSNPSIAVFTSGLKAETSGATSP